MVRPKGAAPESADSSPSPTFRCPPCLAGRASSAAGAAIPLAIHSGGIVRDAPPRILIVEDEPHLRSFLREALKAHGFCCVEAATGREGLDLAVRHRPDITLLDLGLPDIDGLDLLSRLREWSRMPVIVISARRREIDRVAALDVGADDYLAKPYPLRELLARPVPSARKPWVTRPGISRAKRPTVRPRIPAPGSAPREPSTRKREGGRGRTGPSPRGAWATSTTMLRGRGSASARSRGHRRARPIGGLGCGRPPGRGPWPRPGPGPWPRDAPGRRQRRG